MKTNTQYNGEVKRIYRKKIALPSDGPFTMKDVATLNGMSRAAIHFHFKKMISNGDVIGNEKVFTGMKGKPATLFTTVNY